MPPPPHRSLSLPAGFLPSLHHALAHGRTPAEAAALLRQVGYESGEAFYQAFAEENGAVAESLPAERFWERLSAFFAERGWGELRWEPLHPGIAVLDSPDWVEAEGGEGEQHPGCHLTMGLLSDLLTRIANDDVAVLETECRGRGDARCRFLFGSPAVLGLLYEEILQGTTYDEALRRLG